MAAPLLLFPSSRPTRRNLLELWHLLSLDAPSVATLWTFFIASADHVRLPAPSVVAMAVAVWLLYAADRLLDARSADRQNLEARHHFHQRHRRFFLIGIAAATLVLAVLLPRIDPAAIHLYLIEGSFLAGYFVLIHATHNAHRLPKEIAVGLFFAAATFIPTIARNPELRPVLAAPAILFAILCSLNCLFIYAWEHRRPVASTHPVTRFALRYLRMIAVALPVISLAIILFAHHGGAVRIMAAVFTSSIALLLLDRNRERIPATTLRAAADLALLTPLLFLLRA